MSSVAELVKLPIAERLALIDELWVSICEEDIAVDSHLVEEVQSRWQELKADPSKGLNYDELKS